ncbi:MAG: Integral membrane protein, partial [uncultured Frankineae bacterium]
GPARADLRLVRRPRRADHAVGRQHPAPQRPGVPARRLRRRRGAGLGREPPAGRRLLPGQPGLRVGRAQDHRRRRRRGVGHRGPVDEGRHGRARARRAAPREPVRAQQAPSPGAAEQPGRSAAARGARCRVGRAGPAVM